MAAIVGCAAYIPRWRISAQEYVTAWGTFSGGGVRAKAVADADEDAVTMGWEAARRLLPEAADRRRVRALYFASTTPPYRVGTSAATLAAMLGLREDVSVYDLTTSRRSGLAALRLALQDASGRTGAGGPAEADDWILVVAAENPAAAPGSDLEHGLGHAAAALLVGSRGPAPVIWDGGSTREYLGGIFLRDEDGSLQQQAVSSYTDHGDETLLRPLITALRGACGDGFPRVAVMLAHREPARVARLGARLGLAEEQIRPCTVTAAIGDTGAAAALLELQLVLETAAPGTHVAVLAWHGGAAADGLALRVTGPVLVPQDGAISGQLEGGAQLTYVRYARLQGYLAARGR